MRADFHFLKKANSENILLNFPSKSSHARKSQHQNSAGETLDVRKVSVVIMAMKSFTSPALEGISLL